MKIEEKDYKRVFELIGAIYFYGDFVAETVNERELEAILRKYGYFFETEKALLKKLHPETDFDERPPPPPEPPLSRIIRDGDMYSKCPDCGSSRYRKFAFIVSKHCIQPKCKNYYGLWKWKWEIIK